MTDRLHYLAGVIAVAWLVTFALRALPFVLFGGKNRPLPPLVERLAAYASPVIIAALIVYSYSGLAWRTPWPYLAGALTIGLQLAFRNPLVSIVAGTVVYMCVLNCGCTTTPSVQLDMRNPSIRYSDYGVTVNDQRVTPVEVVRILRENDIPTHRVIHIRVAPDTQNLNGARTLLGILAKGGYTRPVLVTERHPDAYKAERKAKTKANAASGASPRRIRYKKAGE